MKFRQKIRSRRNRTAATRPPALRTTTILCSDLASKVPSPAYPPLRQIAEEATTTILHSVCADCLCCFFSNAILSFLFQAHSLPRPNVPNLSPYFSAHRPFFPILGKNQLSLSLGLPLFFSLMITIKIYHGKRKKERCWKIKRGSLDEMNPWSRR